MRDVEHDAQLEIEVVDTALELFGQVEPDQEHEAHVGDPPQQVQDDGVPDDAVQALFLFSGANEWAGRRTRTR